ncbi:ribosome maturation factor [Parasediminibacterium paludis]|uniref:Ribosome maturation factor RimP n=1 Tax=Parasediminibacterium paludis TaxID=908966 RepID=A0ABV8Q223_9BACT
MAAAEQIQVLESFINSVIANDPEIFLVSLKIKPTNNIKVFLDADTGLPIDRCVKINRQLYKFIEEAGMYPEGDFSLEVSSPGITEPLKMHRQYQKNIGRNVEVVLTDTSVKEGVLQEVAEDSITIETSEGKGKKLVVAQLVIPFVNIKSTTVQIKF